MAETSGNEPAETDLNPLLAVMAKLRSPDGCPWDRRQTHESLKPYLIEEAYELLDAIDAGDDAALAEELGDVLLQVVFHATIAAETGRFTMQDVVDGLTAKLIRRHPHVFGNAEAKDAAEVSRLWEQIKESEAAPGESGSPGVPSLMDGLAKGLPALMEAEKLQNRAARVGFEWDDVGGAWEKVREELDELHAAMFRHEGNPAVSSRAELEEELGDVLFALVNVARYLQVDPEQSLRAASAKFRRRFRYIESRAAELGKDLREMPLAEMDALWNEAKTNGGG